MTTDVSIPINDLSRNTQAMRREIDDAVGRVLDSGYFILGPENEALEGELSAYVGVGGSVLVGNGTDALQLALSALGVTSGDAVVTVANAGGYASAAARAVGAVPHYADIDPESHLLSAQTFEAALAIAPAQPKAVVITHLFGAAVDASPIVQLARSRGIAVVEDCAQALGARIDGRMVGTFGDVATTSFYPTKNLGAIGDAGALFGSDAELLARARKLRQYGWQSKYRAELPGGINSRMDEVQAAIVRVKLPHLDAWNTRRREIHAQYETVATSGARFVTRATPGFTGHLAVIEVDDRALAQSVFRASAVATDIHYPVPDHLQPIASRGSSSHLGTTERAADHILSVPLFPELRADEIGRVCDALSRA